MQTRIFGRWGGGLALVLVGLALAARNLQSADSTSAADSNVPAPSDAATPVATDATTPAPAPETTNILPPTQPAPAPEVKLSRGAAEIVRLAQSGVGQDVMLAYVGTVISKFNLGSDQIVYLNDLGVNGEVIRAMIQRDGSLEAASQAATASLLTPPPPAPTYLNPPATTEAPPAPPQPPDATDVSAPPAMAESAAPDDADYFYSSLTPYGSWVYVSGCGLCWQPTVCLGNRDWRPYNDRGRWLYSDCGWYWQSDYSWGWAAFHYGRWFNDANRGWVWAPNRVWGPAWVSWRASSDYCGWAPLPPAAKFVPGVGFFYANRAVTVGFEFGLQPQQYTYIPLARMSDYAPVRYSVPEWQLAEVHNRTLPANHFALENNRVVNRSIDPREVSALAHTEIRRAEIHEVARESGHGFQTDRLSKSGGNLVIYRPQLPAPSARHAGGAPANSGGAQSHSSGNGPRSEVTLPNMKVAGGTPTGVAQTRSQPEAYPPGSLVITGNHNSPSQPNAGLPNMKLRPIETSPNTTYQSASNPQFANENYNNVGAAHSFPEANRPAAGFNFNTGFERNAQPEHVNVRPANGQGPSTYVIPAHYTATQQLNAYSQHNLNEAGAYYSHGNGQVAGQPATATGEERPARESRNESRGEGRSEPRAESRNESRSSDNGRAEVAHAMQAAAAAQVSQQHSAPAQAAAGSSSSPSSSSSGSSNSGHR